MNFYISDMHFGHQNVLTFDNRPFTDIDEMEEYMIAAWNNKVSDDDHVYVIGDMFFRNDRPPHLVLERLKGHKHLVIGNHDDKLLKDEKAMSYFESADYMMFLNDEGRKACLCHFPIAEWRGYYRGSWLIYGHIHARKEDTYEIMKTRERALNAGCMINKYAPATFTELVRNNEWFQEHEDEMGTQRLKHIDKNTVDKNNSDKNNSDKKGE